MRSIRLPFPWRRCFIIYFLAILNGRGESTDMIRIKLFGIARDIVGQGTLEVDSGIRNVGELLDRLRTDYPEFNKLTSLLVAINEEYAELTDPVNENDVVALIPPVSGG